MFVFTLFLTMIEVLSYDPLSFRYKETFIMSQDKNLNSFHTKRVKSKYCTSHIAQGSSIGFLRPSTC